MYKNNKARNPIVFSFQNINGSFAPKATATNSTEDKCHLSRCYKSAQLFHKNAMCTAVHGVADTRLTKEMANILACNMAEKNIFLLSSHMPYGTNTGGMVLMMAPQWAAALISVIGSNDGRTLETAFISKDNLSQILIIVAYPPPAGGTDKKSKESQTTK